MQHSNSALSTTNLTIAQNIHRRNTQQAVPNTTHKPSLPATICLYFKYCAYVLNLKALAARSRRIGNNTSYSILTVDRIAQSV